MNAQDPDSDRHDQILGGMGVFGLLRKLWIYFKPEKFRCAVVVMLVILNALIGRGIVILFGIAVDVGLIAKNPAVLIFAAVAYFVLDLTMMAVQAFISTWFARIGNRVLYRLRDHLISHVQSLPMSYFDRVPSGKIVTRLTADTVSLTELFNQGLLSCFSSAISIVVIVAAMIIISPKMTLLTMLVAPPMIWIAFTLSKKILTAQRAAKKHVSLINSFVAESVSGIRVIQLFNQVLPQLERFRILSRKFRDAQLHTVRLNALFYPAVSLFTAISVATALYVGGDLTVSGAVTTGAMVTFIFHVKDFGDPLRNILERYQLFQNSVSSGERIFSLLGEVLETNSELSRRDLQQPEVRARGHLVFKNVTFRYEPSLSPALNNVSFEIKGGKTLAVIGRTGSGKSTLISLLQRFRDPSAGQIQLDAVDLQKINRQDVRRTIGVVQQDVFLFRGTVGTNISLDDPRISEDRVVWAAEEAGLSRLLQMRPGGIHAKVEERGANLSLGERQLIAFARILAFDPQILILDEATASVDSETERLLQEATNRARMNRTSIIIAHRISTIADADHVLILREGQVIEFGEPKELMNRTSVFREMSEAQYLAQDSPS